MLTIPTYPARPINGGPLDVALAKHGDWRYEPKYNGWRALVHIATGAMFNRHGERLTIEGEFQPALRSLKNSWTGSALSATGCEWLDCEALERRHNIGRGSLFVLDAIISAGTYHYQERHRYQERRRLVVETFGGPLAYDCLPCADFVHVPPNVPGDLNYWERLRACNERFGCEFYEGVVAKRADKPYPIQLLSPEREFPFWMKHRWTF